MSGWNYRLVQITPDWIELHEVYYNENGEPHLRTSDPVGVTGEDWDDVAVCYELMVHAFDKPILDDTIFQEGV